MTLNLLSEANSGQASALANGRVAPRTPECVNLHNLLEAHDRTFWCHLDPVGRPSFTKSLLEDLHRVQSFIESQVSTTSGAGAIDWVVLASRVPGVFSLGGDLTAFAAMIRAADEEGLRRYAHSCIEVGFRNSDGYGGAAISIGLAQGEALGGGFESLLSCDVLIAERRSRFGLPEVLMNLFPGMGAHCFLTRRVGSAAAMKMILSGKVFSAAEMHEMGIVDVLVEDGEGEQAVRSYIQRHASRHRAHAAAFRARRRVSPVTLRDLRDVADIWVETAMSLSEHDLRRIGQLVAAQDRSMRRAPGGAPLVRPIAAGAAF